jgi:hypothetical protein
MPVSLAARSFADHGHDTAGGDVIATGRQHETRYAERRAPRLT